MFYLQIPNSLYARKYETISELFHDLWKDVKKDIQENFLSQYKSSDILGTPFDADFNPDTLSFDSQKEVIDWYFLDCLGFDESYNIIKM